MARGDARLCACGCGQIAKRHEYNGKFKAWRSYASGHSPCERVPLKTPDDPIRFTWQVSGSKVGQILKTLVPYLKEKKQRALLAIELADLLATSRPGKDRQVPESEWEKRRQLVASISAFNQDLRSEDYVQ